MNVTAAVVSGLLGAAGGAAVWRWLCAGAYRAPGDTPRLRLSWAWVVVPLAAAAGAAAGAGGWSSLTTASWVYLLGGVVLGWIDVDVHRVPDRVLKVWGPAVAVAIAAAALVDQVREVLTGAALGALAVGGLFLLLALVGSMGLGDVKLAAVTGMLLGAYGWSAVVTGVSAAFAVGAVAAVVLLVRGAARTSHLPFGPAIVLGAAAAVVIAAA